MLTSPSAPNAVLVAPHGIGRDDWLAARKLGGSDLAAVVGLDKYRSPRQVWLEKRGECPPLPRPAELDEYAEIGHAMEEWIANRFARVTGTRVETVGTLAHAEHPWMTVNIDRAVYGCPDGPCGLECKNRSEYQLDDWSDGVPDAPALQAHWGIAVTGWSHFHVAVLIGGNKFRHFRIERDPELLADLFGLAEAFWSTVIDPDAPAPPVDGSAASTELLAHLWEATPGSLKPVDEAETERLTARKRHLEDQISALEAELAGVENQLKDALGDAEIATDERGKQLYTWKRNGNFASKRFAEAEPELAAAYTRLMPALDVKALAAEEPEIYRRYRARVLRVPRPKKPKTTTPRTPRKKSA